MKKAKKLLAIISSAAICTLSSTPIMTNAEVIFTTDDTAYGRRYTDWDELEDYIAYTDGNIYRSVTPYEATGRYSYIYSSGLQCYSTFSLSFERYEALTEEQLTVLTEFLVENYPTITSEISSDGYKLAEDGSKVELSAQVLNYNADLTPEEKLEIAIDIKENTGLKCSHGYLDNIVMNVVIKDFDYYSALTDDEVYEEYKGFRTEIGSPIADTRYEMGVAYDDFIWTNTFQYNYGLTDPQSIWLGLDYIDSEVTSALCEKSPEYFGLPADFVRDTDYSISYGTLFLQDCSSIYDLMRLQMTLYNSQYCEDYLNGNGSGISVVYIDGFFPEPLAGDVNLNADVEVADAVYILQNIANPSEYAISSLVLDSADITGNNNGIDAEDALAILRQCADLPDDGSAAE